MISFCPNREQSPNEKYNNTGLMHTIENEEAEPCVLTHVALRMFTTHVQSLFLPNVNTELAVVPLSWPVKCMKIGRHAALFCCVCVYFLFCAHILLFYHCR